MIINIITFYILCLHLFNYQTQHLRGESDNNEKAIKMLKLFQERQVIFSMSHLTLP